MKRIFVTFLALALCAAAFPLLFVGAQEGAASPRLSQRPEKTLEQLVRKYERLRLNPAAAARGVRANGRLLLAAPEHKFELELQPNDLRAPDYRAEETGEGGVRTLLASGPVRTYKGAVRGQAKAQARFTVDDETIEGMIITPEERYYVEPLGKFDPEAAATDFVLYKKSDVIEDPDQACGVTMDQEVGAAARGVWQQLATTTTGTTLAAAPGMIYEAEIATEADYEYVAALGSSTAANDEIMSTMNQVDGVYEAELGVTFKLVYQHTWAGKGVGYPYTTTAVGPDVLQQFENHWNANFSGIQRDLAHMWTGKDLVDPNNDPNLIGISNIGTVCNSPVLAYAVSQRMSSASQRAILAAHEIGHNFGATHTSGGDCTTTIMNPYLSGTRLTFCSGSRTQIATFLSTSATCLTQVCRPIISPAAQTIAAAGGAGSVSVTTGGSCAWTAKSNTPWIVINSGASGSGSKTVTYTVAPNTVSTPRTGTLTVAGQTHTVTQAGAILIKAVTLNPANIAGGKKIAGTVGLTAPAPAEGALVTLSDNLAATTVPASVTIAAGKLSAPFTITTVITTTVQTGNVTASYNGSVVSAPLTVRPAALASLKLSTDSALEGSNVTATLTLDGPAPPAGVVVTLSDTLPAATTPTSMTIPSGASVKSFLIPTTLINASQTGVVTASYAGVSKSVPLTVRPMGVAAVVLTPDTVVGGNAAQGLVILEGTAPKNISVSLSENLPSASVAPAIVVPTGSKSATFPVMTTAVTSPQSGVLTAAAQGVSKSLALMVSRTPVQCAALGFAAAKAFPAPGANYSVQTADFNGDGKLDLAVLSQGQVSLFLGSGTGNFGTPANFTLLEGGNDLVVGDFNLDGKRDLAIATKSKVAVLLGNGQGSFNAPAYFALNQVTYNPRSMVVSDFNGDGRQDVAVTNSGAVNISVLLGDGRGGFAAPLNYKASPYEGADLAAGDFNGDGNSDLARGTLWTKNADVMLGTGKGLFGVPLLVDLNSSNAYLEPREVAVGDFNNDGKQDLAFSAAFATAIVLGDGKGGFGPPTAYTGPGFDYELLAKDMNGDGNEDLITLDSGPNLSILPGDGTGKLGTPLRIASLGWSLDIAAGDFNGDGRLDLATTDSDSARIVILLSNCK